MYKKTSPIKEEFINYYLLRHNPNVGGTIHYSHFCSKQTVSVPLMKIMTIFWPYNYQTPE